MRPCGRARASCARKRVERVVSVLVVGSMAVDTVEFAGNGEKHELVGGSATFAALAA